MNPVEILPVQGTIVLRARGSELLIMAQHVKTLKSLSQPADFVDYFRSNALINRPARKLFDAWLRKDKDLWKRIYNSVQTIEVDTSSTHSDTATEASTKEKAASGSTSESKKPNETASAKSAAKSKTSKEETDVKKAKASAAKEDEPTKKAATKKATKAPAKKAAVKKSDTKPAKKTAIKKATKAPAGAKKKTAKKSTTKGS